MLKVHGMRLRYRLHLGKVTRSSVLDKLNQAKPDLRRLTGGKPSSSSSLWLLPSMLATRGLEKEVKILRSMPYRTILHCPISGEMPTKVVLDKHLASNNVT